MRSKFLMAGLAVMLMAGPALAGECKFEGDAKAGKSAANACKGCHVFDAGKPSRPTGPNIAGVFGSPAGATADFAKYSDAMKAASGKVTWDEASLDAYIGDPSAFLEKVNGEKLKHGMLFALKSDKKRAQVIAYLKALKDCQ